ncbi:GntR family transcriptional regulator [Nocardioides carbamazepini]|uniref:FadR/GntR family transcriptional regulator n=1 Tax=Nocardioides carbamazepini TaxID=2854259 RepID=UPI002149DB0A|nr:GntR family transcriptional regulator [Nocardioides carbamazepini]MCR1785071.1 GntR family transcriptional regulator [Nocardioides carbamazepini]
MTESIPGSLTGSIGLKQMSQPSIGERVADLLRERIISGAIPEGTLLPRQEDLMREFNVSRPPMREALRILEAEGLIVVRRGNVGGAEVRAPDRSGVTNALALLLQFERAPLKDLADALVELEPLCVGLAAEREDRQEIVAELLRPLINQQRESLDDGAAFTSTSRDFHEALINACGNATIRLSVGALVTLWSTQERAWADTAVSTEHYPELAQRAEVLKVHEQITAAIEKGDRKRAMTLARGHARAYPQHVLDNNANRRILLGPRTR